MSAAVSDLFDPAEWREVPGFDGLTDVTYHLDVDGRVARVAIDRPEVRNAFRPGTVDELLSWWERDVEGGLGELPFPPDFPKMPGEPPRVQPSRAKKQP